MTTIQQVQTKVEQIQKVIAKPDRPFWKKLGNVMIYIVIPATQIAAIFVPEPYKSILREVVPIISVAIKGGSKLTSK